MFFRFGRGRFWLQFRLFFVFFSVDDVFQFRSFIRIFYFFVYGYFRFDDEVGVVVFFYVSLVFLRVGSKQVLGFFCVVCVFVWDWEKFKVNFFGILVEFFGRVLFGEGGGNLEVGLVVGGWFFLGFYQFEDLFFFFVGVLGLFLGFIGFCLRGRVQFDVFFSCWGDFCQMTLMVFFSKCFFCIG